eukprot:CAMPEP_0185768510 /NCGR_PEP_ID=MMETSP1174-20130828/50128_1 /TAXON_ID=35687 /ORGANISM="Dictyocha speculum, Strain CCMP1381" /LENGTH=109 /DNA_ID=CAMNT_0028453223 /DNA_START=38 /DNA_END=364 /DNA_ORIENTATION=+
MKEAGLGDRLIVRQMERFLKIKTVGELAKVTREDVAELDDLDAKERRSLWQFVAKNQPKKPILTEEPKKGGKKKKSGKKKPNDSKQPKTGGKNLMGKEGELSGPLLPQW